MFSSNSGDDWEHEEIFTDDDEAVGNDPEEREDLAPELPAPPEIKQVVYYSRICFLHLVYVPSCFTLFKGKVLLLAHVSMINVTQFSARSSIFVLGVWHLNLID